MAIRVKNLDLNTEAMKRVVTCNPGVIPVGVTNTPLCVIPVAATVEQIDFYAANGISANTSNTFKINVYPVGASASKLQEFNAGTSAASDTYTVGQRLRLTPSANNSLTAGTLLMVQVSAVCQAVLSNTFCIVTYKPNARLER